MWAASGNKSFLDAQELGIANNDSFSCLSGLFTLGTELAKNVCPRLRDLATAPAGGITQPRTTFFGQLCTPLNTQFSTDISLTTLSPQHPLNQQPPSKSEKDKFDWRFDWQRHFKKNKKFLKEANIINNMY